MDTDVIAREIVSIRSRLNEMGSAESDERRILVDRLHRLQDQLVDPEPNGGERDEVDLLHRVTPV